MHHHHHQEAAAGAAAGGAHHDSLYVLSKKLVLQGQYTSSCMHREKTQQESLQCCSVGSLALLCLLDHQYNCILWAGLLPLLPILHERPDKNLAYVLNPEPCCV